MQGAMGWYMVKSGLIDVPAVSHYRLAAHLSLAFIILSCLLLLVLSLSKPKLHPSRPVFIHSLIALGCVVLTIIWGAFVAGLDAGLIYNDSFPKMGGQWLPPDFWSKTPLWINVFENHGAVQFIHRWLAIFTAAMVLSLWGHGMRRGAIQFVFHNLALMTLLQVGLGIATLLSGVNIVLATLHQAGAAILLMLLVTTVFLSRPGA
jgi:cytochrome c oxidase assembly protein subunit 15